MTAITATDKRLYKALTNEAVRPVALNLKAATVDCEGRDGWRLSLVLKALPNVFGGALEALRWLRSGPADLAADALDQAAQAMGLDCAPSGVRDDAAPAVATYKPHKRMSARYLVGGRSFESWGSGACKAAAMLVTSDTSGNERPYDHVTPDRVAQGVDAYAALAMGRESYAIGLADLRRVPGKAPIVFACEAGANALTVSTSHPDTGEAHVDVAQPLASGEALSASKFDRALLADAIKAVQGTKGRALVTFSEANGARVAIVNHGDGAALPFAIVMAMR